jgi:hypothetical protein
MAKGIAVQRKKFLLGCLTPEEMDLLKGEWEKATSRGKGGGKEEEGTGFKKFSTDIEQMSGNVSFRTKLDHEKKRIEKKIKKNLK